MWGFVFIYIFMLNIKKKISSHAQQIIYSVQWMKLKEYEMFGVFPPFLSFYFLPRETIYTSGFSKLLGCLEWLGSVDQLSDSRSLCVMHKTYLNSSYHLTFSQMDFGTWKPFHQKTKGILCYCVLLLLKMLVWLERSTSFHKSEHRTCKFFCHSWWKSEPFVWPWIEAKPTSSSYT